eukprot:UN08767
MKECLSDAQRHGDVVYRLQLPNKCRIRWLDKDKNILHEDLLDFNQNPAEKFIWLHQELENEIIEKIYFFDFVRMEEVSPVLFGDMKSQDRPKVSVPLGDCYPIYSRSKRKRDPGKDADF